MRRLVRTYWRYVVRRVYKWRTGQTLLWPDEVMDFFLPILKKNTRTGIWRDGKLR